MNQETPSPPAPAAPPDTRAARLRELAVLFLRLGTTAFGGPAAHVAIMEDEIVRRRAWVTPTEFLDLLAAVNFIPGPNSTEMAIHIGHKRAGFPGLLVAGTCFILPAAILVGLIAWAYVHYQKLPVTGAVLYGVKPVVIAIILQALWRLGRSAIKTWPLLFLAAAAAAANALGVHELLVLFLGGLAVMAAHSARRRQTPGLLLIPPFALAQTTTAAATLVPAGLWPMFLVFLKVGSVLFGSGYVLLAFLQADLVERYHWMSAQQLIDATAVGQVTPGPVFTTATFIGYLLGGPWGAVLATVGIFLPAFVFVALSSPLLPHLRKSPTAGAFLDGLNVASLALMAVVSWQLGRAAIIDGLTLALAAISLGLLILWKPNSAWLVLAGGLIGLALHT